MVVVTSFPSETERGSGLKGLGQKGGRPLAMSASSCEREPLSQTETMRQSGMRSCDGLAVPCDYRTGVHANLVVPCDGGTSVVTCDGASPIEPCDFARNANSCDHGHSESYCDVA